MTTNSRLQALDDLLLSLPDDDGMLLAEFDGLCAGLIVCPEVVSPSEWLECVWGPSGTSPFETESALQEALDLVMGHYNAVAQSLVPPETNYGPVFDQDMRTGDTLWEFWVIGFEQAMRLRMDAWQRIVESPDEEAAASVNMMLALYDIAKGKSDLPKISVDDLSDRAPDLITDIVIALNRWTKGIAPPAPFSRQAAANNPKAPLRSVKTGRNEPCPCGSGRKYKRCCGAN
jgi:uncharacterized protein